MLFQQDLSLCRNFLPFCWNEQIYRFSCLIDTKRGLSQMKIQGKIPLQCHTFFRDLCGLFFGQRNKDAKLSVLYVMDTSALLRPLHNSLGSSHNSHHHIHDQCHQEKQCQIPKQVFPDIPKYSFA